jgi:hypothetical protein
MRVQPRGVIALLLTVSALAGSLAAPAAALGDDPAPAEELPAEVRNAIRFREASGLEADVEYVVRSFVDTAAFPDTTYGVPLTAAEARDIADRQVRAQSTQPALDYAHAQVDFAGMYFDQHQQGRPVFRFSDRVEFHREALAQLLPVGVEPQVVWATWSLDELKAVYHTIVEDHATWEAKLPMVSVDVDVITNRVVVGLERPVPDAATSLAAVYGPMVTVEVLGAIEEDTGPVGAEPRERAPLRERAAA